VICEQGVQSEVRSQERLRKSKLGAIFNVVVELKCELWRGNYAILESLGLVRRILEEALRPPQTCTNMYKPSQTCPNISKHTSDSQTHTNLLRRPSDSSHQSGMIPISTGITYIHFISTLSNLTSMETASGLHSHTGLVHSLSSCKGNLREFSLVFPCKVQVFLLF
jgi:hypothetical protein